MTPVPIDADLVAKLTGNGGKVPLTDPAGRPVGYFLSPDQYEFMRRALVEWASSQVTTEELRQALASPRWHSMEDVLKLVEGE